MGVRAKPRKQKGGGAKGNGAAWRAEKRNAFFVI